MEFIEANLLSDKGWEKAMEGCDYVMHIASPFSMEEPENPDEFIKPALEGTQRIMAFAKKAGVKRVVITSSILAAGADLKSGVIDEKDWANPLKVGAYAKSKILAEQAAWDFIEAQEGDDKMELVVLNPGGIMGPTLTGNATGSSCGMIHKMMNGEVPMIPDIRVCMVDVRDVAKVHVSAIKEEAAAGKRFMLASEEPIPMIRIAKILKSNGYKKVSTIKAPNFMFKFMSLFDKEAKGMIGFLGRNVGCDSQSAKEILNWEPTSIDQSIIDMAASLK